MRTTSGYEFDVMNVVVEYGISKDLLVENLAIAVKLIFTRSIEKKLNDIRSKLNLKILP